MNKQLRLSGAKCGKSEQAGHLRFYLLISWPCSHWFTVFTFNDEIACQNAHYDPPPRARTCIRALFVFFLKENARKQKTLVCEKFDNLYSILEEKKREMSQKVTAEQEEKLNYIRGLTRKYGDHLEESCKIVEMGIQTMEEAEMALFLQVGFDEKKKKKQQEEFKK